MTRTGKIRSPDSRGAGSARGGNAEIRFQMEPENRGLSDAQLLADLRRVARRLGVKAITKASYNRFGCVAAETIQRRLGGWNAALAAAGLGTVKRSRVTAAEVVEDFRRVARRLKVKTFSRTQYNIHGRLGATTVERLFGGWCNAQRHVGVAHGRTSPTTPTMELFDNLEMLWQELGRQPRGSDVYKPVSRFNLKTYKNRFGDIRNALRAFVEYKKSAGETVGRRGGVAWAMNARIHKTPRAVNLRLRYLILRRDHFSCRACGRSPAKDHSVLLHVDHIIPWSGGGETVENNLQILCDQCNGGKADLVG